MLNIQRTAFTDWLVVNYFFMILYYLTWHLAGVEIDELVDSDSKMGIENEKCEKWKKTAKEVQSYPCYLQIKVNSYIESYRKHLADFSHRVILIFLSDILSKYYVFLNDNFKYLLNLHWLFFDNDIRNNRKQSSTVVTMGSRTDRHNF